MKVLQMVPSLELGGVERGVVDLARMMKKKGCETVVISSGGSLVAELQKIGITHYELPVHKKSFKAFSLIDQVVNIIQREGIDIVHARSRVPAWIGWFAARKVNVPFVTTCHGYYSNHFLSRIMGWGKQVIVPSHVVGRHMIDDFGVLPERIRLIPRGVDISQFQFSLTRFEKPKSPFIISHIGRFSPIKGHIEFLKAIHLLRSQFPHFEVWLVGREGGGKHKYTDLIKNTIKQFGLESCVKLLGASRDIPGILAKSDLLVMSTLIPEAFGRVIIEAGAVGVPVVSTRVGGVLDIIDHDQNGLLVPPKDIQALTNAMLDLLRDRDKAKQFAISLRKKVEEKFTLEVMTQKNIAFYSEVKKKNRILMIKLGAVGDLILSIPSLRMIKNKFPDAHLSLLVDRKLAALISSAPYLDGVILVDRDRFSKPQYLLKIAKRIREEHFDISVDLQNTKWTFLLAFLAGIPQRFGFSRGKFGFLLNRPDKAFAVNDTPIRHQFRIVSKLGIQKLDETLELWPKPENLKKAEKAIQALDFKEGTKLIGFVVGSSPTWQTKRWPIENFCELAKRFSKSFDCRIFLLGSGEEAFLGSSFQHFDSQKVINLLGKTSLEDLVALFSKLDLVITGDTAPLHIAAAFKTKIIALFGPTDPKRHMPPTQESTIFMKHLPCVPCYSGECKNEENLACLKHITVDEVFNQGEKYLEVGLRAKG